MIQVTVIFPKKIHCLSDTRRSTKFSFDELVIERIVAKDFDDMKSTVYNMLMDKWGNQRIKDIRAYFHMEKEDNTTFIDKLGMNSGCLILDINYETMKK